MRYDSESGKLQISVAELVNTAHRGVAVALPFDEDEAPVLDASKRQLRSIIGDCERDKLYYEFSAAGYDFSITATADKIDKNQLVIAREIESDPKKPSRRDMEKIRAEGFVTAHIFAEITGAESVDLRFIFLNPTYPEHGEKIEHVTHRKLSEFFTKCTTAIAVFARPEIERVTERIPSMKQMKFPYKSVREGQSEFVRAAYRTLARGGTLYASAPTGTGKTVSALYPALRALGDGKRDKVFYLTPKATTAAAAKECLELMASEGVLIRATILTAKEKCCQNNHVCRTSRMLCSYAKCNRLAEATLELYNLKITVITAREIAKISEKWQVCPYELSLSYSELCDVVICDINYLFDPAVYIRRFFTDGGNFAILIDEAHNLAERAREMYSIEISAGEISSPKRSDLLGPMSLLKKITGEAEDLFYEIFYPTVKEEIHTSHDGIPRGAANLTEIPWKMYTLVDNLLQNTEKELYYNLNAIDEEATERTVFLRSYYYKIKKLHDVMALFDSSYRLFVFFDNGELRIKLFCIDTGKIIKSRLAKGAGAVLFSATLSPINYYKSTLGGDASDDVLEVGSPFDSSQLSVCVMDKISTRFSEREDTLGAVCRAIAAAISARRGNYMIFSPSFAYSDALSKIFRAKYPTLNVITQKKNMTAREKSEFIEKFKDETDKSYLVAFCVMGGVYSEGIDLAGDSLIGAIIVGIGMPTLSYEREAIADFYQERYDEGKQYAYIYPGMNRVFQAAGRVIRTENDRGIIVLIDDRFADPIYKKSAPSLWKGLRFIEDPKRLKEVLTEFWQNQSDEKK